MLMRVLLALDGSEQADRARALTASIEWPAGSVIEVISVVSPAVGFGVGPAIGDPDNLARSELEKVVGDAIAALRTSAATIGGAVLTGRPASLIVDEAVSFRADLVIVGSRRRGPIPTIVLGSVSAEVVDHSPCPVLVVRGGEAHSIVVGVDGSEISQAAIDFLAGFGLLKGRTVTIASVFPRLGPAVDPFGGTVGVYDVPPEMLGRSVAEARRDHERYASRAAIELRDAGYRVETDVREGNPAQVLVELAAARDAPMIVLGTRGRTGVTRALLGSVARSVLLHARCSVLVVRGPVREREARLVTSFTRRALQTSGV